MVNIVSNAIAHVAGVVLAAPAPANPFDVPAVEPPNMTSLTPLLFGWARWLLLAAGVLGLFICAGQMLIGRRNRSATAVDGATGIPWVLAGLTVASLAGGVVTTVLQ